MTIAVIDRVVLRASGDDAQRYLHSQLSNDIAALGVGGSAHSFLLEPTGRVVALLRVARVGDTEFLLDFDNHPGVVEAVLARLNRFRIRVKVDFEVTDLVCIAFRGESPPAGVNGHSVVAWWGDDVDVIGSPVAQRDNDTWVSVEIPSDVPSDVSSDSDAIEAARVAAGWPAMGREIVVGETLPSATGVVAVAVSFTKGCYPGQELVERMDSRGATAPRTLRRIDDAAGLQPGAEVVVDGKSVGTVTSVAAGRALAYVDRGVDVGSVVSRPD